MHSPGKGVIEDRQPAIDFVGLDGDRRGDAEYAEKFAQAVSIRDSSPDIDAEWPWSGS